MLLHFLFAIVTNFIIAESVVLSLDYSQIQICSGELIPRFVYVFGENPVKSACGSLSPVTWTYKREFSLHWEYNTTSEGNYIYIGNNEPLPTTHIQQNNTIILTNLRESDSGYYYCFGTHTNNIGQIAPFLRAFRLNVLNVAPIGYVLPSLTYVSTGDNATFVCGSSLRVEWFFRSIRGQEVHVANKTLYLYYVRKEHSGLYICRGFRRDGNVFHFPATLFVDTSIVHNENLYSH